MKIFAFLFCVFLSVSALAKAMPEEISIECNSNRIFTGNASELDGLGPVSFTGSLKHQGDGVYGNSFGFGHTYENIQDYMEDYGVAVNIKFDGNSLFSGEIKFSFSSKWEAVSKEKALEIMWAESFERKTTGSLYPYGIQLSSRYYFTEDEASENKELLKNALRPKFQEKTDTGQSWYSAFFSNPTEKNNDFSLAGFSWSCYLIPR